MGQIATQTALLPLVKDDFMIGYDNSRYFGFTQLNWSSAEAAHFSFTFPKQKVVQQKEPIT